MVDDTDFGNGSGSTQEPLNLFLKRLGQQRVRGAAARDAIITRLASMTAVELRTVPLSIMSQIGPEGLATLAQRSAALRSSAAGLSMAVPPRQARAAEKPVGQTPGLIAGWRQRRPLLWEAAGGFALALVLSLAAVSLAPIGWRMVNESGSKETPRLCSQLDPWTGDCRYLTGSRTLTLNMAAGQLRLSPDALRQANPRLQPDLPLSPGTIIAVPRRPVLNLR